MTALFSRKKNTICGVIVDIGSGSVAASILLSERQRKLPEIIYTHRESMPMRKRDTFAERISAMRHALSSTMREIERTGIMVLQRRVKYARVEQILISVTAPWSHVVTQIIHFEGKTPFIVTKELVDQIVLEAHKKEGGQTQEHADALEAENQRIVEKIIVDVKLNGYSVQHPYGTEAAEITIAHLRGLVSTSVIAAIEDIRKNFEKAEARIHTSALILYCVLRDLYPKTKDALILDVSGEATQAILMQNGILYESITAPCGTNTLIREVARLQKTIPEEARGYLGAYKQNVLTKTQQDVLLRVQENYAHMLAAVCAELEKRYVLPKTIFCIPDQNMEPFFTDAIGGSAPDNGQATKRTLIVLSLEKIRDLSVVKEMAALDPRLALIARFFHTLHRCGEIDNCQ